MCTVNFAQVLHPARALFFSQQHLKLNCCPGIKSDAQSATHTVAVSNVAWPVTHDVAKATQVFYIPFRVLLRKK
jgi:hypothetical protein